MEGKVLISCGVGFDFQSDSLKEKFLKIDFKRVSDHSQLIPSSLYFCGHKKFLSPLREVIPENFFVLFSEEFFQKNKEELESLLPKLSSWATTKNLPLSMSLLSKPFFDLITANDNDEVDGRQMGTCEIHPTAIIAQNVFIGAHVVIEAGVKILPGTVVSSFCKIGENTTLHPNVTLNPRTVVGKNCRIHSGTVIGADGFGYNFDQGVHHKVWHMGGVKIGDHVEIGSNTCVDQGTFSPTIIGSGSKIDNQVQIGHNVKLGQAVILCGQVGLSGSSSVGDYSVFGGMAGLSPDTHVGKACQVGGMAGVISSIDDNAIVAGFPARPIKEWLKGLAYLRKAALKK